MTIYGVPVTVDMRMKDEVVVVSPKVFKDFAESYRNCEKMIDSKPVDNSIPESE